MTLIKSISGIRGTIGGPSGDNLTPPDIISFTSGYASLIREHFGSAKILVGRDGRNSGEMIQNLVQSTLISMGIHVLDTGLTTTPSIEMAVKNHNAQGAIMITASHNPMEWNALKFINEKGEFIDNATGAEVLRRGNTSLSYNKHDQLGSITTLENTIQEHIADILNLPLVNVRAVQQKKYKAVVDAINSTGALAVPPLLKALGVDCIVINEEISGVFNHNPEPLPENIKEIQQAVIDNQADLGIIIDPDVDRLAFVCEDGSSFGEEYTLVAVADYILSNKKGNTVSNLSSTLALRDITKSHHGEYYPAAVGEVNVVAKMKEKNAVIGGEGNGGVIYPDLHYGRDALVGIALFLTHLAAKNMSLTSLKAVYPSYEMSKNKIELHDKSQIELILTKIKSMYAQHDINSVDGVKITMQNEWLHLRQSNTEPIIRIYAESTSKENADRLANEMIANIKSIQKTLL